MAKIKVENNFIWIILAAIRIYSTNFLRFCGYMLFPVLGQVLGLMLVFSLSALFTAYLPELADKYAFFRDYTTMVMSIVVIIIPGLLIFMKAFWDYLVAYGAINSITDGFLTTGKIYDFPAHKATITTRSFSYIGLWILYSIFISASILIPVLWLIGAVFFVYFVLVFQVFSFEPDKSPTGCFGRSFEIIKGNGFRTLLIMAIIGIFTHILFVQGFSVIFDFTKLTHFLGLVFDKTIVELVPIDIINDKILMFNSSFNLITPSKVSEFFVYQTVSFIVIGFTLPLRSITWALWYKALAGDNGYETANKGGKRIVKRVSAEIINRAKNQRD